MGPPCCFLKVKRSKILQKLNQRDYCCNILGFIFGAVSRAKTDFHSKYIFNFVFGSFFEQDHLLNLFILRVYAKRLSECTHISKQKLRTIHWGKKSGVTGLVSEKVEALCAELNQANQAVEAATSSYSATGDFLQFVLCLWLRIIRRSDQGVQFMNFTSQSFWLCHSCGYLLLL